MKNKIQMLKTVGGTIVTIGVGCIVGNAIRYTTPATIGLFKKGCVVVGGFVLSSMIGDKAWAYTDDRIDDGIKGINKIITEIKEAESGECQ